MEKVAFTATSPIVKTLSDTRDSQEGNKGVLAFVQMLRGQTPRAKSGRNALNFRMQGLRSIWLSAYARCESMESVCRPSSHFLLIECHLAEAVQSERLYTAVIEW